VKTLLKAPKLTVSEAMLVAKFSTKDIADKNMQRNVSRHIPGGKRALHPALLPLSIGYNGHHLQLTAKPRHIHEGYHSSSHTGTD
jgi:hypothetical protein